MTSIAVALVGVGTVRSSERIIAGGSEEVAFLSVRKRRRR